MSNVGQDVEHIRSCLQIRRCGSFPLVWSEFGAGEEEAQFGFTGVQRATQAAPAKIHEYISDQTLMTFWIKANILLIFAGFTELLAAQNVEKFVYNFTVRPSVPKI